MSDRNALEKLIRDMYAKRNLGVSELAKIFNLTPNVIESIIRPDSPPLIKKPKIEEGDDLKLDLPPDCIERYEQIKRSKSP